MASLTRGGVEQLAFGRQFPTLGQGRQPDVDLTPVLQALGAPLPVEVLELREAGQVPSLRVGCTGWCGGVRAVPFGLHLAAPATRASKR